MATEKSVDVLEEVETIESEERRRGGKGCKVQVGEASKCATVEKINCCDKIITNVCPIEMCLKEVENSILKGKVMERCPRSHTSRPVANALVVATPRCGHNQPNYVALTDNYGEYRICVPASKRHEKEYIVEAYYCGSCTGAGVALTSEEE